MVLLEIERETYVAVVEADLPQWEAAYDRLFARAGEAAQRHGTDVVVGFCDDALVYVYTVEPVEPTESGPLKGRMWSLVLHFIDPDLERKRRRYDELAWSFGEDFSWELDE